MSTKLIYDLSCDVMFKSVFSKKEYAKYLLKYLFDSDEEIIEVYKEFEISKTIDSKTIYCDVCIRTRNNIYIAEMQNKRLSNLSDRLFYYQTSLGSVVLDKGKDYGEIKKVKIACICNFRPLNKKRFRHKFKVSSREYKNICFDFFNCELINLKNVTDYKTDEERDFFNCFRGIYADTEEINKIRKRINLFNNNEEWMNMNREKLSLYYTAFDAGETQGVIQGKKEGKHEILCNMIIKLKDKGYSKEESCTFMKDTVPVPKKDIIKAIDKIYK